MKRLAVVVSLLLATAASPAAAADCASTPAAPEGLLSDSIRGRALIRAAAVHLGGAERIAGIRRLREVSSGTVSNGFAAYDPAHIEAPDLHRAFTRAWELDFENRRHRRVSGLRFDGATLNFVEVYEAGHIWTASPDRNLIWTTEANEEEFTDSLSRYAPPLLVARALEHIGSAIWAGDECASGTWLDRVDFSWNDRVRLRLYVGRDDHAVRRVEATTADPLLGDDVASYDFEGELSAAGILFPRHVVYRRRGAVFSDVGFTSVEVNPDLDASLFVPSPGLVEVPAPGAAYAVGDGAYEMALGEGPDNYAHFFDLGNAVAVFDAPLSDDVSRQIEAQVRATLGAKPIAYVVLSHFHDDHIGGVGYFARRGAHIVAPRDSEDVIRRFANARSRLSGTAEEPGRPLDFLLVDNATTLPGTNGRSLTLFPLTGLPHVRSMLVAYYPRARMIANSDLFGEFAPFDDNSRLFAQWLLRPGAPRVDWIVGGHHRRISAGFLQDQSRIYSRVPRVGPFFIEPSIRF